MSSTKTVSDSFFPSPSGITQRLRHREEVRRWKIKHPAKVRALARLNYSRNKAKFCAKAKRAYRKKPEIWLRSDLRKRYNLSLEDFRLLLTTQNGVCAICGAPETGRNKRLSVDHDHVTKMVRGLLCNRCNSALGLFKDSLQLLTSAVEYLRRAEAKDGFNISDDNERHG